ncbi:flavin reductase family protein, partial [Frankia sp. AgKG'84/4]|nr:flavin reductase family protein [Frankia sp. AgKG'84/4]
AQLSGAGAGAGAAGGEVFRQVFRRHAAGVTIVTMAGARGPSGFTATSVTSLSERPPLLSLALSTGSSLVPALLAADSLVVHLLSHDQRELAARFARPGADRFAPPTRWRPLDTGEPLLLDAAVWIRCGIRQRLAAGDHWLVIAEVLDSRTHRSAAPLVYHDGDYGTFHAPAADLAAQVPAAGDTTAGPVRAAGPRTDGDLGIRARRAGHPTSGAAATGMSTSGKKRR